MVPQSGRQETVPGTKEIYAKLRRLERRDWWLWVVSIFVLLLLTGAGVALSLPVFMKGQDVTLQLKYSLAVRGLLGLVLLYSTYAIYQQILIKRLRGELIGHFEMAAALSDALTGLANRTLLLGRLARALKRRIRRQDYLFAVLFLDLDRFKMVNDSLGYNVGDQLLMAVGRRLEKCLRSQEDTVARLGGDEFTMFLENIRDETDATRVAERVHKELRNPFQVNGHEVFTTSSIGIALSSTGLYPAGGSPARRRHGHVSRQGAWQGLLLDV